MARRLAWVERDPVGNIWSPTKSRSVRRSRLLRRPAHRSPPTLRSRWFGLIIHTPFHCSRQAASSAPDGRTTRAWPYLPRPGLVGALLMGYRLGDAVPTAPRLACPLSAVPDPVLPASGENSRRAPRPAPGADGHRFSNLARRRPEQHPVQEDELHDPQRPESAKVGGLKYIRAMAPEPRPWAVDQAAARLTMSVERPRPLKTQGKTAQFP